MTVDGEQRSAQAEDRWGSPGLAVTMADLVWWRAHWSTVSSSSRDFRHDLNYLECTLDFLSCSDHTVGCPPKHPYMRSECQYRRALVVSSAIVTDLGCAKIRSRQRALAPPSQGSGSRQLEYLQIALALASSAKRASSGNSGCFHRCGIVIGHLAVQHLPQARSIIGTFGDDTK